MTRSELLQHLCNKWPGIRRKDMDQILKIIIIEMMEAVCRNEAVEIRGWGRIFPVARKSRIGRNPKDGSKVEVPSKKAIRWKCSKTLFNRLNKNFTEDKISDTY